MSVFIYCSFIHVFISILDIQTALFWSKNILLKNNNFNMSNCEYNIHSDSQINIMNIAKEESKENKIDQVVVIKDEGILRVIWDTNTACDFPFIFLRDSCQCALCVYPISGQRLLDTVEVVDIDIEVADVHHDVENNTLVLTWPDNHQSIFCGKWLKDRRFPAQIKHVTSKGICGIQAVPWSSAEMNSHLPFTAYDELMASEQALLSYFENLFKYGLSIITGAPTRPGLLQELSKRLSYSYMKQTIYGETFSVRNKPSASDIAYMTGPLAIHSDMPSYAHQPDVQFLHCIEQSAGEGAGTSLLTDGIRAVHQLVERDHRSFKLLTEVRFTFRHRSDDVIGKFNIQNERPIIQLDAFGNVESIGLHNHSRLPLTNVPSDMVKDCYEAYYALIRTVNEDVLYYQMKPGDVVSFNNKRVLHGRTGFNAATTSRWLEGGYMNFDELKSKYRVVKEQNSN